jgi:hypothetical protein
VLVLAVGVVAGESLGVAGAVGVLLVATGVVLVRGFRGVVDARGVALALAIGGTIAGYTLVDKQGLEHAAVVPYLELVLAPVAAAILVGETPSPAARGCAGGVRPRVPSAPRSSSLASRSSRWARRS